MPPNENHSILPDDMMSLILSFYLVRNDINAADILSLRLVNKLFLQTVDNFFSPTLSSQIKIPQVVQYKAEIQAAIAAGRITDVNMALYFSSHSYPLNKDFQGNEPGLDELPEDLINKILACLQLGADPNFVSTDEYPNRSDGLLWRIFSKQFFQQSPAVFIPNDIRMRHLSPLEVVCCFGDISSTHLLLERGAKPTAWCLLAADHHQDYQTFDALMKYSGNDLIGLFWDIIAKIEACSSSCNNHLSLEATRRILNALPADADFQNDPHLSERRKWFVKEPISIFSYVLHGNVFYCRINEPELLDESRQLDDYRYGLTEMLLADPRVNPNMQCSLTYDMKGDIGDCKLSDQTSIFSYIWLLDDAQSMGGVGYDRHLRMIDLLLSCDRVDLNIPETYEGNTPLHAAVLRQNIEVVNKLIERGADATITNFAGETPLEIARRLEFQEGISALETYEAESKAGAGPALRMGYC